jgi:hypothetical protein
MASDGPSTSNLNFKLKVNGVVNIDDEDIDQLR